MTTVVRMTEIVEPQHYLFFVTELKHRVFFALNYNSLIIKFYSKDPLCSDVSISFTNCECACISPVVPL